MSIFLLQVHILDDFGLKTLDSVNRHVFMEIIEDRHGKRSSIIFIKKWL